MSTEFAPVFTHRTKASLPNLPGKTGNGHLVQVHAILLLGLMALPSIIPALAQWPWRVLAPLCLFILLVACVPALRRTADWARIGKIAPVCVTWAVGIGVTSALCIVFWYVVTQPDLRVFHARIPQIGSIGLAIWGVAFAAINSTIEEVTWRGVVLGALEIKWGFAAACVIQAVAFGVGHSHGVPQGVIGMILATGFGVALGALKSRSNGLGLCVAAHFVADLAIFGLIVYDRILHP